MRLVIRGTKFQAAREAARRGIPLAFQEEIKYFGAVATIGKTSHNFISKVKLWAQQSPGVQNLDTPSAPYAVGTMTNDPRYGAA